MEIVVPDDQLSLAIGKRGQNVRLAVMLTGWRIDIKSESKALQQAEAAKAAFMHVPGMTEMIAQVLINQGITSLEEVAEAPIEALASFPGIGQELAERLRAGAADPDVRAAAEAAAAAAAEAQARAEAEARAAKEAAEQAAREAGEAAAAAAAVVREADAIENVKGVNEQIAESLRAAGFTRVQDILNASVEVLQAVPGIGDAKADKILDAAREYQAERIRQAAAESSGAGTAG